MAGTLTISTLSDGTNSTSSTNCIQGSAKAWVNFNGTNASIRASYNVSSVTRNGTGDYTVTMTNAMSDANYTVSISSTVTWGNGWPTNGYTMAPASSTNVSPTSSTFRFATANTATAFDSPYVMCSVFR